ncbi:MAG: hypothetical protein AAF624_08045 [Bacteroidota bacterium]
MRTALLRRVKAHLLARPDRLDTAQWAWCCNLRAVLDEGAAPEGFRCCLAGHVLLLDGVYDEPTMLRLSVERDCGFLGRQARIALDATEAEQRLLFYPSQWPKAFRAAYYTASRAEEAGVVAAFLDHVLPATLAPAPDRAAVEAERIVGPAWQTERTR